MALDGDPLTGANNVDAVLKIPIFNQYLVLSPK